MPAIGGTCIPIILRIIYMNNFTIVTLMTLATAIYLPAAHAYVDPGSGGAIITAILGAIGALGYTFRKYYYNLKKLFSKKKSDDNSRTG